MDITSLSSLPTDSLYKFMSLTGVVVALLSAVLPELYKKNLKFQLLELRRDIDIHKINHRAIEEALNHLMNEASHTKSAFLEKMENGEELSSDSDKLKVIEIARATSELKTKSQELERVSIQIGCETSKVKYLSGKLFSVGFLQSLWFFVGVSLCSYGFYLWYTRLQVYVDASLKSQGLQ